MRKIILICPMLLLLWMNSAFAHTHLSHSNPEDGAIITKDLTTVQLVFEGKLEEGSTFELKDSAGEVVAMEMTHQDATLTGTMAQPLTNGEYTAIWQIIGADGHLLDGNITFTVEQANTTTEKTTDKPVVASGEKTTRDTQKANDEQPKEKNNYLFLIGIIVLAVVIVGFLLTRKKRA